MTEIQRVNIYAEPEDIVIPLVETDDGYISLDGHTRLALAVRKQFSYVLGFLTEADFDVNSFVEEARKREIFTPYDLKVVSHAEYEILWNEFCADFMSFYNRFIIRNLHKFEYAIIRRINKGILEIHGHIDFNAVKVEEIFFGYPWLLL